MTDTNAPSPASPLAICDGSAAPNGGVPDQNADVRLACPADFAQWGAALGFQAARGAAKLRPFPDGEQRIAELLALTRVNVGEFQNDQLAGGASQDEVNLYRQAFETALGEGLLAQQLGRGARSIMILAAGGNRITVEDAGA